MPKKTYTNCLSILCLACLSWQALGFHYKNCKKTLFGVHAQVSFSILIIFEIFVMVSGVFSGGNRFTVYRQRKLCNGDTKLEIFSEWYLWLKVMTRMWSQDYHLDCCCIKIIAPCHPNISSHCWNACWSRKNRCRYFWCWASVRLVLDLNRCRALPAETRSTIYRRWQVIPIIIKAILCQLNNDFSEIWSGWSKCLTFVWRWGLLDMILLQMLASVRFFEKVIRIYRLWFSKKRWLKSFCFL